MPIKRAPMATQHAEHEALASEAAKTTKTTKTKTTKRINFDIDTTLHRALKTRASGNGETIAEVLTRAIHEYLSRG